MSSRSDTSFKKYSNYDEYIDIYMVKELKILYTLFIYRKVKEQVMIQLLR